MPGSGNGDVWTRSIDNICGSLQSARGRCPWDRWRSPSVRVSGSAWWLLPSSSQSGVTTCVGWGHPPVTWLLACKEDAAVEAHCRWLIPLLHPCWSVNQSYVPSPGTGDEAWCKTKHEGLTSVAVLPAGEGSSHPVELRQPTHQSVWCTSFAGRGVGVSQPGNGVAAVDVTEKIKNLLLVFAASPHFPKGGSGERAVLASISALTLLSASRRLMAVLSS